MLIEKNFKNNNNVTKKKKNRRGQRRKNSRFQSQIFINLPKACTRKWFPKNIYHNTQ